MYSLTTIFIMLVSFLVLYSFFTMLYFYFLRRKETTNTPSWSLIISLGLQILILVLFFSTVFVRTPIILTNILWWSVVIIGFIISFKNSKNSQFLSIIVFVMSICLGSLGFITLLIGSM